MIYDFRTLPISIECPGGLEAWWYTETNDTVRSCIGEANICTDRNGLIFIISV